MSDSQVPAQSAPTVLSHLASGTHRYELSDDLARLCLPQEWKDSCKVLAWVNSVCALFLLVGLVGLKAPKVIIRPLTEIQEAAPVVPYTPPEDAPKPTPVETQEQPDQPVDTPTEVPQVVTVTAIADPSAAAFPVPVTGPVAIAPEARLATPPPPVPQAPPAPVRFNPNASGGGGSYPAPKYPGIAQRNHYEGTVIVEFHVDESGAVTSAKVQKSSGFPVLDDAAQEVVSRRWRFPAGPARWFTWACTFTF